MQISLVVTIFIIFVIIGKKDEEVEDHLDLVDLETEVEIEVSVVIEVGGLVIVVEMTEEMIAEEEVEETFLAVTEEEEVEDLVDEEEVVAVGNATTVTKKDISQENVPKETDEIVEDDKENDTASVQEQI